jgi:hypothetical protein
MNNFAGLPIAVVLLGGPTFVTVFFAVRKALSKDLTRWQATLQATYKAVFVNALLGLLFGLGIFLFGILANDPAGYGKAFFTVGGFFVLLGGPLLGAGVALMGMIGPILVVPLDRPNQSPASRALISSLASVASYTAYFVLAEISRG